MNSGEILIPDRYANILDSPKHLYARFAGSQSDFNSLMQTPMVAVVGARSCTTYGATVAHTLSRHLAENGVTVVSGLARGVDAEAHRGSLAGGGPTIAFLGCGIDRDYPSANSELARRIVENGGAILSEYIEGTPPAPWRFPARNRLVAASDATVVVESRDRSGALITADLALEYGRPVLAVPGEITSSLSYGTNDLLRRGVARICMSVDEVLEAVGHYSSNTVTIGVPA